MVQWKRGPKPTIIVSWLNQLKGHPSLNQLKGRPSLNQLKGHCTLFCGALRQETLEAPAAKKKTWRRIAMSGITGGSNHDNQRQMRQNLVGFHSPRYFFWLVVSIGNEWRSKETATGSTAQFTKLPIRHIWVNVYGISTFIQFCRFFRWLQLGGFLIFPPKKSHHLYRWRVFLHPKHIWINDFMIHFPQNGLHPRSLPSPLKKHGWKDYLPFGVQHFSAMLELRGVYHFWGIFGVRTSP